MGLSQSYPLYSPLYSTPRYPLMKDYEAAGVLFIDDNHFLAGYQPKKRWACITGIGGAKEDGDDSYVITAFRELFEELFGWQQFSPYFLNKIAGDVEPAAVFQVDSYVTIALSFKELEKILRAAKRESPQSPFYDVFPTTPWELIRRRVVPADAEIQHLVLLPVLEGGGATKLNLTIHSELLDDVKMYLEKIKKG